MWDPLGRFVAEGDSEKGAPVAKQYNMADGSLAQRFPVGFFVGGWQDQQCFTLVCNTMTTEQSLHDDCGVSCVSAHPPQNTIGFYCHVSNTL